ncbi:MAG: T9SS type A sorting domain-containing protein [Reichenbachiella sp.]|uniref:T9SS type A sorting domain-containing protein n=1 Tax=Reichenbachiella sp. TaxID=2184521 RepID=UPI003299748E
MRLLLLAICLFTSSTLFAQNHPAPFPESEYQDHSNSDDLLKAPFLISDQKKEQTPNQRIVHIGQSKLNEEDRLIYDSLVWEVYDEEKEVWDLSSINKYTRDENGNVTTWLYQLYDSESKAWVNKSKYEKVYNENKLEISYIRSNWDTSLESWVNEKKILQDYDAVGRVVFYEFYIWNNDREDWEGSLKDGRGYDEAGSLTFYLRYSGWDWEKGWVDGSKSETSFNADNQETEQVGFIFDSEKEIWEFSSKREYSYLDNELIESRTYYDWDTDLEDWVGEFKDEFQYYSDDSLKTELRYYWREGSFEIDYKTEYSYDNKNEEIQIGFRWLDDKWNESGKSILVYNDQNLLLSRKHYSFIVDGEIESYELNAETVYTWDNKGQLLIEEYKSWNSENNEVSQGHKYVRSYHGNGEYTVYENYSWDANKQLWDGDRATYTTYGKNNYILDIKKYNDWDFETNSWVGENRYTYEVNDHNKRLSSDYYNWIEGDWKYTYRANYYFHLDCSSSSAPVANYLTLADQTELCSVESLEAPTAIGCGGHLTATTEAEFPIEAVGTTEVTWTYDDGNGNTSTQTQNVIIDQSCQPLSVELNNLVEVYPNPSLGQINFKQKIDEVEVFNQTGQLEMKIHSPGSSINVSKLKAGIYYLTLKYQTNTARVKIIKN